MYIELGSFPRVNKFLPEPVGSMCYMSGSIQMKNFFVPKNEAGMWQWLFGKSMTSIVLLNTGAIDGFVGIAAPLARILLIDLAMFGGELLCQVVEDGDYDLAKVPIGNEKRLVHILSLVML
ncbi:hypothetical protein ACSBR1_012438 [Camellia fascicularis]